MIVVKHLYNIDFWLQAEFHSGEKYLLKTCLRLSPTLWRDNSVEVEKAMSEHGGITTIELRFAWCRSPHRASPGHLENTGRLQTPQVNTNSPFLGLHCGRNRTQTYDLLCVGEGRKFSIESTLCRWCPLLYSLPKYKSLNVSRVY